jgi:hypothetical protein
MNKNLLLVGAVAVASYLTLTAFGGKTKAEQMAEISDKVKMGLDDLRTEEKAKCDTRVAEAVETKYAEMVAATPEPAPMPTKAVKGKGGPKAVKPLPAGKAGTVTDPVKTRGGAVQQGTEQVKERGGAVQQGTQDVKKRGGAVKQGGGK